MRCINLLSTQFISLMYFWYYLVMTVLFVFVLVFVLTPSGGVKAVKPFKLLQLCLNGDLFFHTAVCFIKESVSVLFV